MTLLSAGPDDGGTPLELMRLRGHAGDPLGRVRRFGHAGWRVRAEAPVRKTEALAACLLRLIADGTIAPGDRLPGERRLAGAGGMSRVSVRSGLGSLARWGLVEPRTGRIAPPGHPVIARLRDSHRETLGDAVGMVRPVLPWLAKRAVDHPADWAAAAQLDELSDGAFCLALAHATGSGTAIRLLRGLELPLRSIAPSADAVAARAALLASVTAGQAGTAIAAAGHYGDVLARAARHATRPSPPFGEEAVLAALAGLRHAWLADRVEHALRHLLARSDLPAGARLPGERRLADQLGTSRATVRLALERLRSAGLIEVQPRKGAILARPPGDGTRGDGADSFLDLIELRAVVEGWAVRRACGHASGTALGRLRRVTLEITRPHRSERYRSEDDMAFHHAVSLASGSALHRFTVESMQDLLLDYFDRAQVLIRAGRPRDADVADQHAGIARAIERGEPELATTAMAEHSRAFEVAFLADRLNAR